MNNSELQQKEMDVCKGLVSIELDLYDIKDFFTEEQVETIHDNCYRNMYRYGLSNEFAVRDAVSSAFLDGGIVVPENYMERFWIA